MKEYSIVSSAQFCKGSCRDVWIYAGFVAGIALIFGILILDSFVEVFGMLACICLSIIAGILVAVAITKEEMEDEEVLEVDEENSCYAGE